MTKAQQLECLNQYRREHGVGRVMDPKVENILRALLRDAPKHRRRAESPLWVINNSGPVGTKTSTCYAVLVGSTFITISAKKLIYPPSERGSLAKVFRLAVGPDSDFQACSLRTRTAQPVSAVSGIPLVWDDTEVDHEYHFALMVADWMRGVDDECSGRENEDGQWAATHPGDYDPDGFAEYHRRWAVLRLLTTDENRNRPNPESPVLVPATTPSVVHIGPRPDAGEPF